MHAALPLHPFIVLRRWRPLLCAPSHAQSIITDVSPWHLGFSFTSLPLAHITNSTVRVCSDPDNAVATRLGVRLTAATSVPACTRYCNGLLLIAHMARPWHYGIFCALRLLLCSALFAFFSWDALKHQTCNFTHTMCSVDSTHGLIISHCKGHAPDRLP